MEQDKNPAPSPRASTFTLCSCYTQKETIQKKSCAMASTIPDRFHPLIASWFAERHGLPTECKPPGARYEGGVVKACF
jgi:hypothetical protein